MAGADVDDAHGELTDEDDDKVVFQDSGGNAVEVSAGEPDAGDVELEPSGAALEEPLAWPSGDPRWLLVPGSDDPSRSDARTDPGKAIETLNRTRGEKEKSRAVEEEPPS